MQLIDLLDQAEEGIINKKSNFAYKLAWTLC